MILVKYGPLLARRLDVKMPITLGRCRDRRLAALGQPEYPDFMKSLWLGEPAGVGGSVDTSGERYQEWNYYHGAVSIPGGAESR